MELLKERNGWKSSGRRCSTGHWYKNPPGTVASLVDGADGDDGQEPAPARGRMQYTCPMHPDAVLDKPEPCPKCGMKLEPEPHHRWASRLLS